MKKLAYVLCITFMSQVFSVQALDPFRADRSQKDKPATIKILLDKNLDSVLLEIKGRHEIFNPGTGLKVSSGFFGKREFIKHDERGIRWGDLLPGTFETRFVPADGNTTLIVNGTEYRGCVEVYDMGGKFTVINEIDIEHYLKTFLSSQFSRPMDDEVLEAVAIAARTNAYFLASKNHTAPWQIDAKEVLYQGYGSTLQNLQVERAVDSTRYVVMTHSGSVFPTTWTKNSAGKTVDFATIFRKNAPSPEGISVTIAEKDREKMQWAFSLKKKELASMLGLETLSALDLFIDKTSGKVYAARVQDRGGSKTLDFATLQKRLGEKRLRSSDFTTQVKGDTIHFTGYGEGPGVGLCLFSADKMAENGDKAPKLLTTFYPGVKIEHIRTLK